MYRGCDSLNQSRWKVFCTLLPYWKRSKGNMRFSAGKVQCEFASGQADLTKTFDIFLAIAPWAVTGSLSWSWSPHSCPFAQIDCCSWRELGGFAAMWYRNPQAQPVLWSLRGERDSHTWYIVLSSLSTKLWFLKFFTAPLPSFGARVVAYYNCHCVINLSSHIMLTMNPKYFAVEEGYQFNPHFLHVEMMTKRDESI